MGPLWKTHYHRGTQPLSVTLYFLHPAVCMCVCACLHAYTARLPGLQMLCVGFS